MAAHNRATSIKDAVLNFDIDRYLNPFIPSSPVRHLPTPLARFLGYRKSPPQKLSNVMVWFWAFIGAFCGIALIEGVYRSSPTLWSHHPPIVIGSFGAAAILEYNTIESPLAQPRNVIGGQVISTAIGIGITKLFQLLPPARFEDLQWLAGALAVGVSSAAMGITKTVHPPAGATALLAATDPQLTELGWYLLVFVMVACALMLGSACVVDNVQRQFPMYWWTPADLSETRFWRKRASDEEKDAVAEKSSVSSASSLTSDETLVSEKESVGKKSVETPGAVVQLSKDYFSSEPEIRITHGKIFIPEWMEVDEWQKSILQILQQELKQRGVPSSERHSKALS